MKTILTILLTSFVVAHVAMAAESDDDEGQTEADRAKIQAVIDQVEKACLERTVYMIGRQKAERLAELVRQQKPRTVVECGTAIGYSGLWIARELKAIGRGRLITLEINPQVAREAEANFKRAGVDDVVTVRVGDARKLAARVEGPIDLAFIDCNAPNYHPILLAIEDKLPGGAMLVADNVALSRSGMTDYLQRVRANYTSRTEWFEVNLPWAKRDAMEISVVPK